GWLRERIQPSRPAPSRARTLGARPVRNTLVEWERRPADEDRPSVVLLRVPRRADRFGNLVARWFRLPSHRRIELDTIGSDVWEACDGARSVEGITRLVCEKYRLNRRQGETSVTAYLRLLAERRLIGLASTETGGKGARRRTARQ
ncbi:MAG: PqqD family protein, partial [Armatimonadota bacterium]